MSLSKPELPMSAPSTPENAVDTIVDNLQSRIHDNSSENAKPLKESRTPEPFDAYRIVVGRGPDPFDPEEQRKRREAVRKNWERLHREMMRRRALNQVSIATLVMCSVDDDADDEDGDEDE